MKKTRASNKTCTRLCVQHNKVKYPSKKSLQLSFLVARSILTSLIICFMSIHANAQEVYEMDPYYNTLQVELIDATGKSVLTQKMKGGDHDALLGIAELKPGVYFLRLIGDNSLVTGQRITIIK